MTATQLLESIVSHSMKHQNVCKQIEVIARLQPNATALVSAQQRLTYGEITAKSDQIAQHLIKQLNHSSTDRPILIGPGLDHHELIIAMLGILKSGRFFVYVNDGFPAARITEILEDADPLAIVVKDQLPNVIAQASSLLVTPLMLIRLNQQFATKTPQIVLSEHFAQKILAIQFTSGTTGRPKGIIITHERYQIACQSSQLKPGDRVATLINFGVSGVLLPLMRGATSYLYDPRQSSIQAFIQWLKVKQINILAPPVGLFRQLLEALPALGYLPDLQHIFLFGQAVLAQDIARYREKFAKKVRLYTLYSTTETFGIARFYIDPNFDPQEQPAPAGYAVSHKQIHIVDEQGQSLPEGSIGEVAVSSAFLSPGYWRQPVLTAERFLPKPDTEKTRTYLTGDLGYLDADGCLRLIGRKDRQVKVRGFRIELEAVERALFELPWIQQAAVICRQDHNHEPRLAGYIMLYEQQSTAITIKQIRQQLNQKLPVYMVPTWLVFVSQLPLLPSLKVDLKQLPAPDLKRQYLSSKFIAPRFALEKTVLACWQEIFQLSNIGVRDNFYELGGDSLNALQLIDKVGKTLDIQLPHEAVAKLTTVEWMCEQILNQRRDDQPTSSFLSQYEHTLLFAAIQNSGLPQINSQIAVSLNADGKAPPLFWCFNTPGLEAKALGHHLGKEQPLIGLISGVMILVPFNTERINRIAQHYVTEITRIQPDGPYCLGGNCSGAAVIFEVAKALLKQGKKIGKLCLMEFFHPQLFDYRGDLCLLIGKESHLRIHDKFNWQQANWQKQFTQPPWVDWLPGPHGQFFNQENIPALAHRVLGFLHRT